MIANGEEYIMVVKKTDVMPTIVDLFEYVGTKLRARKARMVVQMSSTSTTISTLSLIFLSENNKNRMM